MFRQSLSSGRTNRLGNLGRTNPLTCRLASQITSTGLGNLTSRVGSTSLLNATLLRRDISQHYDPTQCETNWYSKQATFAVQDSERKFRDWSRREGIQGRDLGSLNNAVNKRGSGEGSIDNFSSRLSTRLSKRLVDDTQSNHGASPSSASAESRATSSGEVARSEVENIPFGGPVRNKDSFSIMLPPPNITGRLHIGHALTLSIEDALARYHLMTGRRSVFIPGMDHAGISTQVVVEKKLAKENKFRKDMTRQEFLVEMRKWQDLYRGMIREQIEGLGAVCDWDREVFTMDPQRELAVKEAFIRLFDNQYIYREKKLVNWCCHLQTAISDIEVESLHIKKGTSIFVPSVNRHVKFGLLHHFKYPLLNEDGSISEEDFLQVSTTRIETMIGDTAIAIHSEDERYKKYHGRYCFHPFTKRKIPIICDDLLVDPKFGTGAVKITPAHDFNDFECGKRHDLESVSVFDRNGNTIRGIADNLFGEGSVDRYMAREIVIEALKSKSLYVKEEDHEMQLPICERSKDVLEPMVLPQWFVKCKDFAQQSLEMTESGILRIHPEKYKIIWQRWLEGIHDWCISRQLWWGHQIPAYQIRIKSVQDQQGEQYLEKALEEVKEKWIAAHSLEEAETKARKLFPILKHFDIELLQDEDVLDTWFSSGLYPIAGLGWPNLESPDLKTMYPLSVLETGEDILFFWAARMVMLCSYLYQPIEGKKLPPFYDIYLHSMVRDSQGRKMSKSLGNVIDPMDLKHGKSLEALEQDILNNTNISQNEVKQALGATKTQFPSGIPDCGIDGMRFSLLQYTHQGRSINLDVQKVVSNRQFCNKIWQATRFAEKYLTKFKDIRLHHPSNQEAGIHNQWILSELALMLEELHSQMEGYQFSQAANTLHDFFLYKFCDVYLELVKRHLNNPEVNENAVASSLSTLHYVLDIFFRASHPFLPFISDELWHCINPQNSDTILSQQIPSSLSHLFTEESMSVMEVYLETAQKIRSVKALLVDPSDAKSVPILLQIDPEADLQAWNFPDARAILSDLTNSQNITIDISARGVESSELARFTIFPKSRLYIPFSAKKVEESIKRLEKELKSLRNAKEKLLGRMVGERYANTPEAIKLKDEETLLLWSQKENALMQELDILKEIKNQN